MGKLKTRIWGLAAALPVLAQAQIDLKALDRDMAGPRAQVLVLGTVQLRFMPDDFNPASLNSLLDRLAAFKPQIITIKQERGLACDLLARRADDNLNAALLEILEPLASRKEEGFQVAARLAARLGLGGVVAIDDHTGDNIDVADGKAYAGALKAAWSQRGPQWAEWEKRVQALKQEPDLLPLCRFINDPRQLRVDADANVGAQLRAKSAEGCSQMWVAGWEIRNFRMIAC